MKRIDRYLLTHHPLVWNLRLHWVLPALLVLHVLFYLAGLAEPQRLTRLNYMATSFPPVATSLAVLLGVLVVIGWLIFYLRNNAFKSFYPVRSCHLLAEFFWSLVVVGLASTLSVSHQLGRYQRLDALTKGVDVLKEANTAAVAHHFLPFEGSQFENYNSCDSQRARDSLVGMSSVEDGPPPERMALNGPDTTVERSYLHYCAEPSLHYSIPATLDRYGADSVAKGWMLRGQRDSVRTTLAAYTAMVKKYGGDIRLDVAGQVAEIFATPRFLVRRPTLRQYDDPNATGPSQEFIETHTAQDALVAITEIRKGVLSSDLVLAYLYWALAAALLLFTFRITRLRTWFGAGIGVGIWMVIFSVLAAVTQGEKDAVLPVFFLVVIASVIFTAVNVSQRRRKVASGFTFLWAVWSLPAFGLALVYYIRSLIRHGEYRYNVGGVMEMYEPSPVAAWIDANGETIAAINLVIVLVLVALYVIPQGRRWQAAPEE